MAATALVAVRRSGVRHTYCAFFEGAVGAILPSLVIGDSIMAARTNNTTVLAKLRALETNAIEAVKAIDAGYAEASKAILAFTIGCRGQTPAVFEAGLSRIVDAAPGIATITVRAYASNARRIFAASQEAYDAASKTAGTESIKALSTACPALAKKKASAAVKRESANKIEAEQKKVAAATAAKSGEVTVTTPTDDPLLAVKNDLVRVRRLANGKAKSRIILAAIGEIEDMIETIAELLAA